MKYTNYAVMDFVMDEYFQQWVLHPDQDTNLFWQQWMVRHPEKSKTLLEARNLLLLNKFDEELVPGIRLAEIKENIKKSVKFQPAPTGTKYYSSENFNWRKIAATAGLLFLLGLFLFTINREKKLAHVTNYGQIKEFVLPDSSRVFLNANSSLECLHSWKKNQEREVWLDGEAFFKVTKKENFNPKETAAPFTKFVVHVDGLDIVVQGTQFNVNNRKDAIEVVLKEGKVKVVSTTGDEVDLQPGEMITYSNQSKTLIRKVVDAEKQTSWRNHQLFFDGQNLLELAEVLEVYYGVQVTFVKPELKNKRIIGILPSNNLNVIIESLNTMYGLQIKKDNNKILFQ